MHNTDAAILFVHQNHYTWIEVHYKHKLQKNSYKARMLYSANAQVLQSHVINNGQTATQNHYIHWIVDNRCITFEVILICPFSLSLSLSLHTQHIAIFTYTHLHHALMYAETDTCLTDSFMATWVSRLRKGKLPWIWIKKENIWGGSGISWT